MTKSTKNLTSKELFNAKSSTVALQKAGEEITITGCAIDEVTDTVTGDVKCVTYLFEEGGHVYGTISASVYNSASELIDYIDDINEPVQLRINRNKSNAGREFLTISVL